VLDAAATGSCSIATSGGSDDALVGVYAPITACGNAVAVLDAAGEASCDVANSGGGNGSLLNVNAPVTVCGNAVALLGAGAGASCGVTGAFTAGNGLVDIVAPVGICGNVVGAAGSAAAASCTIDNTVTPGTGGLVSVLAPVGICGNALAVLDASAAATCADAGSGTATHRTPPGPDHGLIPPGATLADPVTRGCRVQGFLHPTPLRRAPDPVARPLLHVATSRIRSVETCTTMARGSPRRNGVALDRRAR